jgi:hypothetical protein
MKKFEQIYSKEFYRIGSSAYSIWSSVIASIKMECPSPTNKYTRAVAGNQCTAYYPKAFISKSKKVNIGSIKAPSAHFTICTLHLFITST